VSGARAGRWLLPLALAAGTAHAQEWHESYRAGVKALADGQAARAVSLLEHAVSLRAQPGRNVITYGTNVEPRYYPYLQLAEAYLRLKDAAGLRSALQRSERWAVEPAAERARLRGELEALAPRAAPTPATTPTAPPVTAPAAPDPPPPAPSPTPLAVAPAVATPVPLAVPTASPGRGQPPPAPRPRATAWLPAETEGPTTRATATLDVVSHPPGAAVYLDDELLGTTDAEWGRLVRSGLVPGPHRIRISLAGHAELAEEILLRAEAPTEFRRRLVAARPSLDLRVVLATAIVVALLGATAWALRRPSPTPAPEDPADSSRFSSVLTPVRPAEPDSPGIIRDPDGVERFGEYRLLERLGRGGMASVYKAERRGEICALKRPLRALLEEPQFLERFVREAEIGRTLHHPNIVRILERGEVAGVPYFTMELVEGETLQARLKRAGPLEPRGAAGLIAQVAEALDYAHLKGVVHRDLKPSNIMVESDGTARVMDYGIARARRFDGLTVTGAFLGTPEYVAPEAIEGQGTDARSDLYSLGVVFYETLTGARPFAADTPFAVLRRHLTEPPAPPTSLRPGVPAELERIVLRLLKKLPEERYAGAEELVGELRDFLNRTA
jgi:hypothetical protein